jgi:hypothetical protein
MENKVKILKITHNLILKDEVKIQALADCGRVFGSIFGSRIFYLKKNDKIIIKMRSKDAKLLEEGEIVNFEDICNGETAWQFSWDWHYKY